MKTLEIDVPLKLFSNSSQFYIENFLLKFLTLSKQKNKLFPTQYQMLFYISPYSISIEFNRFDYCLNTIDSIAIRHI